MKTFLILVAVAAAVTVTGAFTTTSSEAHTAMTNSNDDIPTVTHKKLKIKEHKKRRKHIQTMAQ